MKFKSMFIFAYSKKTCVVETVLMRHDLFVEIFLEFVLLRWWSFLDLALSERLPSQRPRHT